MEQEPTKLQRNKFIISLSGQNIDTAIVNIEEMQGYVKTKKKFAIIGTEKKTYDNLEKTKPQFIMNNSKPKIFVVDSKKKEYIKMYASLLEKFSGLMIVETDTISDQISELICSSELVDKKELDIMICRNGLADMTDNERRKANYLRIHADPEIDLSIFEKLGDFYKEKTATLMIAQLFVNSQYDETNAYIEQNNELYAKQGMSDFVDYYELNKQLSYFLYYDVENNKILNLTKDVLEGFVKTMKAQGLFPMPDEEISPFCQNLTLN